MAIAQVLGAVSNEQGFPYLFGRDIVKKLVHESMIQLGARNIGALTSKRTEVVG